MKMAFGDLLEQVGSVGRFQVVHVVLLAVPVMMMASHNLLQNFVAAVPSHYCRGHTNVSLSHMSPEEALLITVPLDRAGRPQRCQRYAAPQWHLLADNGSSSSGDGFDAEDGVEVDLQGCQNGWFYNTTERTSTIISEVFYSQIPNVLWSKNKMFLTFFSPCVSGIWSVICAL